MGANLLAWTFSAVALEQGEGASKFIAVCAI